MTRYVNSNEQGSIQSADITVSPDASMAYLHLRDASVAASIRAKLEGMGRTVLAQTTVDGRPMLVTSGPRSEAELVGQLSSMGEPLLAQQPKKQFNAWKVRSALGFGGQTLQLTSAFLKHKVDVPLLVFASSNMTANGINWAYTAQKKDDPHQLRMLKQAINARLTPVLVPDEAPIDVEDKRILLREQGKPKAVDPFNEFMKKNSVNVGELGLRYVGAFGMAFPASDWPKAVREGRLPVTDTKAPLRTMTGLTSMVGKTIAVTSKVPDPYNPKPRGFLDGLREKYSFLVGGMVETGAFAVLAYDAFMNTGPGKREGSSIKLFGSQRRDWLSGIGATMFTAGYVVRAWAKFGERVVDMPELYAHTSDMLALVTPEHRGQALADTSAYLADHFKGQPGISYSSIYTKLNDDLCRSHHLSMQPSIHAVTTGHQVASEGPAPTIQAGEITHTPPQAAAGMAKTA